MAFSHIEKLPVKSLDIGKTIRRFLGCAYVFCFIALVGINAFATESLPAHPSQCAVVFSGREHASKPILADDFELWDELREHRLLVNQNSIPEKSGLCQSACTINAIQAVAKKQGLEPLHDPQHVFERLVAETHGGLDNRRIEQFVLHFQSLYERLFARAAPHVRVQVLKGFEENAPHAEIVESINPYEHLRVFDKQIKLVAFVNPQTGIGHIQIIEEFTPAYMKVVEPNAPYENIYSRFQGMHNLGGASAPGFYEPQRAQTQSEPQIVYALITIQTGI